MEERLLPEKKRTAGPDTADQVSWATLELYCNDWLAIIESEDLIGTKISCIPLFLWISIFLATFYRLHNVKNKKCKKVLHMWLFSHFGLILHSL